MEVTIKSNKERDNVKNTQTNASELNNEVIIAEIEEIVAKSSTNEYLMAVVGVFFFHSHFALGCGKKETHRKNRDDEWSKGKKQQNKWAI